MGRQSSLGINEWLMAFNSSRLQYIGFAPGFQSEVIGPLAFDNDAKSHDSAQL
jgi:hypothetical protein